MNLRLLFGRDKAHSCLTTINGVSNCYEISKIFHDAVNSCTALSMKFPEMNEDKQSVMN
jgi:hypothetical protein